MPIHYVDMHEVHYELFPEELVVTFDRDNENWTPQPAYNNVFLRGVSILSKDQLLRRGYLFLNEVRDELGFAPIGVGQVVGWTDPESILFNYVFREDDNTFEIRFVYPAPIVHELDRKQIRNG